MCFESSSYYSRPTTTVTSAPVIQDSPEDRKDGATAALAPEVTPEQKKEYDQRVGTLRLLVMATVRHVAALTESNHYNASALAVNDVGTYFGFASINSMVYPDGSRQAERDDLKARLDRYVQEGYLRGVVLRDSYEERTLYALSVKGVNESWNDRSTSYIRNQAQGLL